MSPLPACQAIIAELSALESTRLSQLREAAAGLDREVKGVAHHLEGLRLQEEEGACDRGFKFVLGCFGGNCWRWGVSCVVVEDAWACTSRLLVK